MKVYGGIVILLSFIAAAASAAEVRLRSSSACSAPVVRLADVAEVFADDQRLATALADIPLCPAPAAGKQRSLSQHDVRQLLVLSGVDTAAARLTGSETVTVTAERATMAPLARRPLVASGVRQAAFEAETGADGNSARGQTTNTQRTPTEETIKETPSPSLVERGAAVTVVARAAGVMVTTSGKTVQGGAVGDTVQVELLDTKQRVFARVVGPQTVEVTTDSRAPAASIAAKPTNQ